MRHLARSLMRERTPAKDHGMSASACDPLCMQTDKTCADVKLRFSRPAALATVSKANDCWCEAGLPAPSTRNSGQSSSYWSTLTGADLCLLNCNSAVWLGCNTTIRSGLLDGQATRGFTSEWECRRARRVLRLLWRRLQCCLAFEPGIQNLAGSDDSLPYHGSFEVAATPMTTPMTAEFAR